MTRFRVYPLLQSSVLYLYSERSTILLDPPYQRFGEVWTPDKRQLLIDSILNGFDIPKLYFHEPQASTKSQHRFSIVDGRQRLETIWGFIDGAFALADDFRYLADPGVKAEGFTYRELGEKYPRVKALFDSSSLPVVVVQTDDIELIEEMFSRLNEAVPLNAAEKRNALGGPAPGIIRKLAKHPFFTTDLPTSNRRMQHLDLAAKFLYLAHKNGVADIKKVYLDEFVRAFRGQAPDALTHAEAEVARITSAMAARFVKHDSLLRSSGMAVLYFLLCMTSQPPSRKALLEFESARARNRAEAERDITKASYELLEFDRLNQTPNDAYAIEFRLRVLRNHLVAPAGTQRVSRTTRSMAKDRKP